MNTLVSCIWAMECMDDSEYMDDSESMEDDDSEYCISSEEDGESEVSELN